MILLEIIGYVLATLAGLALIGFLIDAILDEDKRDRWHR